MYPRLERIKKFAGRKAFKKAVLASYEHLDHDLPVDKAAQQFGVSRALAQQVIDVYLSEEYSAFEIANHD